MCHTYFFKNYFEDIAYADADICLNNYENHFRNNNRVGNSLISENNQIWIYQTVSPVKSFNQKNTLKWQDLLLIKYDLEPVIFVYSNPKYTKRNFNQELYRFLRPDLLLNENAQQTDKYFIIIYDYKYVNFEFYLSNNNIPLANTNEKYRIDLIKQLTYEFALQQNQNLTISKNCFLIPQFFHECQNIIFQDLLKLKEGIIVQSIDFSLIQKSYLEENK